jgi:hypothetical protein
MSNVAESFWESFGTSGDLVEVKCDAGGCLAADVLDAYGIPYRGAIGGSLPNLDIKRLDAIQVIKLSLLEASAASGEIYEMSMGNDGVVDFIAIGVETGLSGGDIYYEIQSGTYRESCGGVMVIGSMPLAKRKEVDWKPIWQGGEKEIYDTTLLVNQNCLASEFSLQATIVFNEPHLDSTYEDGIDNLYEITKTNPYDHILGYARYIEWPDAEKDKDTKIRKEDTTTILLPLTLSFGEAFVKRPDLSTMGIDVMGCYESGGIDIEDPEIGVLLEIPTTFRYSTIRDTVVDKLQSVLDVYVIGLEITDMRGVPPSDSEAANIEPEDGSAILNICVAKSYRECFKLAKGTHYVVGFVEDADEKKPYIVFMNNARADDPILINSNIPTPFVISPESTWTNNGVTSTEGYILPTGGTHGILVESMFVSVLLETPSIVVFNPDGKNNKAKEIAELLTYWVAPLVSEELPRPVAFNGALIDMSESIIDHDPTTAQDLTDTEYEIALDEMQGSGLTLSLSFLDGDQCATLSDALYTHLNSGGGTESTYVCGPNAEASLGGIGPNGGIVNSIVYSYQDCSSYTISVSTGPVVLGDMSQIDGGPSPLRTEDVSTVGTVIQDMGNHVNYKVRIDGYGERVAINLSNHIIRVGDKVSCTVHNNPVES